MLTALTAICVRNTCICCVEADWLFVILCCCFFNPLNLFSSLYLLFITLWLHHYVLITLSAITVYMWWIVVHINWPVVGSCHSIRLTGICFNSLLWNAAAAHVAPMPQPQCCKHNGYLKKKQKKNDSPASEEDRSVQPDWAELSSANLRHCDFREFTDSYLSSILASSLPALGQQTV